MKNDFTNMFSPLKELNSLAMEEINQIKIAKLPRKLKHDFGFKDIQGVKSALEATKV